MKYHPVRLALDSRFLSLVLIIAIAFPSFAADPMPSELPGIPVSPLSQASLKLADGGTIEVLTIQGQTPEEVQEAVSRIRGLLDASALRVSIVTPEQGLSSFQARELRYASRKITAGRTSTLAYETVTSETLQKYQDNQSRFLQAVMQYLTQTVPGYAKDFLSLNTSPQNLSMTLIRFSGVTYGSYQSLTLTSGIPPLPAFLVAAIVGSMSSWLQLKNTGRSGKGGYLRWLSEPDFLRNHFHPQARWANRILTETEATMKWGLSEVLFCLIAEAARQTALILTSMPAPQHWWSSDGQMIGVAAAALAGMKVQFLLDRTLSLWWTNLTSSHAQLGESEKPLAFKVGRNLTDLLAVTVSGFSVYVAILRLGIPAGNSSAPLDSLMTKMLWTGIFAYGGTVAITSITKRLWPNCHQLLVRDRIGAAK